MGRSVIRNDIVAAVEAVRLGFSLYDLIVEYDNKAIVDTKEDQLPFLCVRIKYIDAYQRDLGDKPGHRFIGQIELAAAVPENSGVVAANKLLDFFYPKLHKTALGSVRTYMADVGPQKDHLGWSYHTMLIPFWSDQPS